MRRKKGLLVLQAAVCVLLALLLAAGAVGIYAEGSARKAENPLETVYSAEETAEKLGRLIPVFLLAAGLFAAGLLFGVRAPAADQPGKTNGPMKPGNSPKHKPLIQAVLIAAAVVFIILGVLNGSAYDVLVKAIHLCTECIGLG